MNSTITPRHTIGRAPYASSARRASVAAAVPPSASFGSRSRLVRSTCFPLPSNPFASEYASYKPRSQTLVHASSDGGRGPTSDDVLVEVDSVKVHHRVKDSVNLHPSSYVVYLRIVGTDNMLPVHIGEAESTAILKELNKAKQLRPMTHDLTKTLLQACGFRVTKIRITELKPPNALFPQVAATYYSRVYVGRANGDKIENETDVDARPSDAINLALRFGAPLYVSKNVAGNARSPGDSLSDKSKSESEDDIVLSVRSALSSFEDPTVMFELHKSLAIQQQRFEDAQHFQQRIYHEMTHNQLLRLVVAMEAALSDGRLEEAARLRDEYNLLTRPVSLGKEKSK